MGSFSTREHWVLSKGTFSWDKQDGGGTGISQVMHVITLQGAEDIPQQRTNQANENQLESLTLHLEFEI